MTNSKVKFVMVVDSSNTALRDNEIRSVSAPKQSHLGGFAPSSYSGSAEKQKINEFTSIPFSDVPKAAQFLHWHHVQPFL